MENFMSRSALATATLFESDEPAIIVFGLDGTRRAHASWFDQSEIALATAAAAEMGMAAVQVASDELRALAGQLPHGRLFASGRAFVPYTRAAVYDRLASLAPRAERAPALKVVASGPEPLSAAQGARGSTDAHELPQDWAHIKVGSLVLATEDKAEGYFESVVVEAGPSDMFTLRWRDYPELDTFVRHRSNLALLFPAAIAR
jgi:hypothetical protein